ncbi:MAG: serine hydrolase domain-containing protein, partial [Candidatus Hodarchaeota archaeon]
MKGQKFFLIIILCLFLSIFWNSTPITAAKDTYYPINGWRTSTLEKQGLNAEPLKNMENVIEESRIAVDSILIVRNGFLVYEKHFPYYDHANVHQMFSTTKSITSILIGIANNSGFITDLDQSIVEIFPGKSFTNMDDRKRNITIRHLLAMQCGLRWPEWSTHYLLSPVDPQDYEALANYTNPNLDGYSFNPANIVVQMANSSDWVQFVLDQPMVTDPGTSFNYNTGASHLLSVILQEKTNMSASQFAKEYLFGPLNITEYYWWMDPQGYTLGGYGIWLAPEDMAKI